MHNVALKPQLWYLLAVFAKLWAIHLSRFIEKKRNLIPPGSPLLILPLIFFLMGIFVLARWCTEESLGRSAFYKSRLEKQKSITEWGDSILDLVIWLTISNSVIIWFMFNIVQLFLFIWQFSSFSVKSCFSLFHY